MAPLLIPCVALIDPDNRILLSKRPEGKPLAGLWEFPGGKLEAGETPERCLEREIEEELGVKLCVPCLSPVTFSSHTYTDTHIVLLLYICRKWEGIPRPQEGQQFAWVRKHQLANYLMPEANKGLVVALRDSIPA